MVGIIWSYSLIKTQSIFSKKAGLIFKVFISNVSWLTLIAAIYFGYKNFSIKFILIGVVLVVGVNLGLNAINSVKQIQEDKLDRLCKIDYSFCTPESK